MRYGAMNFPVNPVLSEIATLAGMGFDYLELALDPPQAHYSQILSRKNEIMQALSDHAMGLVCHLPTFVFTADLTDSIRQASLDEMLQSLETAQVLQAEKVVVHPSIISGLGSFVVDQVRQYATASLQAIIRKAADLGITLCLENMFPGYGSFFEASHFTSLLAGHPALKITLDIGHANINNSRGQRYLEFIQTHGDRIGHVHLSDNRGSRDDHLPIGEGTINWRKVAQALRSCGYDDTVTLEVFSENRSKLHKSLLKVKALFKK